MIKNFVEAAGSIVDAAITKRTRCESVIGAGGLICGLGAVGYLANKRNHRVSPEHYAYVEKVILLGMWGNDHYDTAKINKEEYKKTRRQLSGEPSLNKDFQRYHFALAKLERNRPVIKDGKIPTPESVIKYREEVNAVSLQIVFAAAGIKNQNAPQFKSLYESVMALQVADDLAVWNGDLKNNRPSFYTAYAWNNFPEKDIQRILSIKRNEYLKLAINSSGKDMAPIIFAAAAIAFGYPLLTDLATSIKASGLVMSPRDAKIA